MSNDNIFLSFEETLDQCDNTYNGFSLENFQIFQQESENTIFDPIYPQNFEQQNENESFSSCYQNDKNEGNIKDVFDFENLENSSEYIFSNVGQDNQSSKQILNLESSQHFLFNNNNNLISKDKVEILKQNINSKKQKIEKEQAQFKTPTKTPTKLKKQYSTTITENDFTRFLNRANNNNNNNNNNNDGDKNNKDEGNFGNIFRSFQHKTSKLLQELNKNPKKENNIEPIQIETKEQEIIEKENIGKEEKEKIGKKEKRKNGKEEKEREEKEREEKEREEKGKRKYRKFILGKKFDIYIAEIDFESGSFNLFSNIFVNVDKLVISKKKESNYFILKETGSEQCFLGWDFGKNNEKDSLNESFQKLLPFLKSKIIVSKTNLFLIPLLDSGTKKCSNFF